MPLTRKPENRGLPVRWQHTHGAYYFRVPPGSEHLWDGKKRFQLGRTLPDAYKVYAEHITTAAHAQTIGNLLDRYLLEVVPAKAPKTQTDNKRFIQTLRKATGAWPLTYIRPQHIHQYVQKRSYQTAAHPSVRPKAQREGLRTPRDRGAVTRIYQSCRVGLPQSAPVQG